MWAMPPPVDFSFGVFLVISLLLVIFYALEVSMFYCISYCFSYLAKNRGYMRAKKDFFFEKMGAGETRERGKKEKRESFEL